MAFPYFPPILSFPNSHGKDTGSPSADGSHLTNCAQLSPSRSRLFPGSHDAQQNPLLSLSHPFPWDVLLFPPSFPPKKALLSNRNLSSFILPGEQPEEKENTGHFLTLDSRTCPSHRLPLEDHLQLSVLQDEEPRLLVGTRSVHKKMVARWTPLTCLSRHTGRAAFKSWPICVSALAENSGQNTNIRT